MTQPPAIHLSIDSRLENVALLGIAIRGIGRHLGFPDGDCLKLELSVVEIASNCIRHAYGGEAGHPVRVRLTAHADRLEVVVLDDGLPVPEDQRAPRAIDFDPGDVESIPEGGRGIFLVHALMDTVEYRHEGSRNAVVLTKARPSPDG